MDYFFMSKGEEEKGVNPMIVMVDESSGNRYARAVPQKGVVDWVVVGGLRRRRAARARAAAAPLLLDTRAGLNSLFRQGY